MFHGINLATSLKDSFVNGYKITDDTQIEFHCQSGYNRVHPNV